MAKNPGSPVRRNNYDFLRISAAVLVVLGHAFSLTGSPRSVPAIAGMEIHSFGVVIFFSLSGYLVTKSAISNSLKGFFLRRGFRLFPGLLLVTIMTTLVIGPGVSSLGISGYFQNPNWHFYFLNLVFYPVYSLPGVFGSLPYPNAVNGSLWTLPVEFAAYILAAALVLISRKWVVVPYILIFAVFAILNIFMLANDYQLVIYGSEMRSSVGIALFFFAGGSIYLIQNRFKNFIRLDVGLVAFISTIILIQFLGIEGKLLIFFTLPYLVIAFGELETPFLRSFGRFGDPSYGIYLWAFPLQQLILSSRAATLSFEANILLVIGLSALMGYLSWHLLERRAIAFASRMSRESESKNLYVPKLKKP
jgi:peptidoglycan/LPS O-acetylase OafA/YrhL